VATKIQLRRGTSSQWTSTNPVLSSGEVGFETNTNKFKIGDGATSWTSLKYFIDLNTVNTAISDAVDAVVGLTPDTLDTLKELADSINNDPNFFTSVTASISAQVSTLAGEVASDIAALTTNDIGEGSNLYFVNSRVTDITDNLYVKTASAGTSYLTPTQISDTYLTKLNASVVYATKDELDAIATGTGFATIADPEFTGTIDSSGATLEFSTRSSAITANGATLSATELSYLDGASSNIQTQLNSMLNTSGTSQTKAGNLTVSGDLAVGGNLAISGSLSYTQDLVVVDPLIYLGEGNTNASIDLGIVASTSISSVDQHTGLVRDASENRWKLFRGVIDHPTTTVNFTQGSLDALSVGSLYSTGNVVGHVDIISQSASYTLALTDDGDLVDMNVASANNLTVPANSSVTFPIGTQINILQSGAGQTTIVPATIATTTYSSGGASGATTVVVASGTGIAVGQLITGTNIAANTLVTNVSGTTITFDTPTTGQVSGTLLFRVGVVATPTLKLRTKYSSATLIKRSADGWVLIGDLSAT